MPALPKMKAGRPDFLTAFAVPSTGGVMYLVRLFQGTTGSLLSLRAGEGPQGSGNQTGGWVVTPQV